MLKRAGAAAIAVMWLAVGCGGGAQSRTVLLDHSNDEFATAFLAFFPSRVAVHPGDTLVFRQTWTGEPHTVTTGRLVEGMGKVIDKYMPKYLKGGFQALPREEPPELIKAFEKIPPVFDEKTNTIAQNGAQPCYLDSGEAPKDIKTPCPHREQPAFNGRQSLYSSGYIHYAGADGNTYRMPIAKDATPGHYYFFCIVHGPLMGGYIDVKSPSEKVPSQDDVTKQARREIALFSKPLEKGWTTANAGKVVPPPEAKEMAAPGSKYVKTHWAGFAALPGDVEYESWINEFIPRRTTAKVGEPVTWTTFGGHTISFNVPKYLPIFTVNKDGTVERNPKLDAPAGGAPKLPQPDEEHPKIEKYDGGTFNGNGFWSSGMINTAGDMPAQYTVRFSKAGTYRYACLVHPAMVAQITITP